MKQIKWIFLVYAMLSALGIMGIGVAIAAQSILGVFACLAAIVVIMGMGFKKKRKMRESGEL